MKQEIFILKNVNSYEDGDQYFHVDLFTSEDFARAQMCREYYEFFESDFESRDDLDVADIGTTWAELRDGDHVCTWEITSQELNFKR